MPSARRRSIPVRVRITVAVTLAVTVALGAAGLIVYAVESDRIEARAVAEIDQEFAELQALRDDLPQADIPTLLDTFLARNVPDDNEILISWYDGRPQHSTPPGSKSHATDPTLVALVTELLPTSGSTRTELPWANGESIVTVQRVANNATGAEGALVVVTSLDLERLELVDTMRTYAAVALVALLLVTAVAAGTSGRLLAPLRTLRRTAEEITATDLSRRIPATGHDDITALTQTVNTMLDRLEGSFADQQQFLDDVGHELRTPLTVIGGHLEVLDASDPDDVEETRRLVLDEVDRMARLVGDLLTLAKHGRPDFLRVAVTDLGALTRDVHAKAAQMAPRTWRLDAAAAGDALVDAQRLTQALLQLCDNAVKHTEPGAEIAIGSKLSPGAVSLWVRDTGTGVAPQMRAQIFGRFARGEQETRRDGLGLGLAIVDAIANAHGGRVSHADVVPHGSVFTITVPIDTTPEQPDPADSTPVEVVPFNASGSTEPTDHHQGEARWPAS